MKALIVLLLAIMLIAMYLLGYKIGRDQTQYEYHYDMESLEERNKTQITIITNLKYRITELEQALNHTIKQKNRNNL